VAFGRTGEASAVVWRLWNGESTCLLVRLWRGEPIDWLVRFANHASDSALGALHLEGAATKVDREYADSDVPNFCFLQGPSLCVGRRMRDWHCLIHSLTLATWSVVSAACDSLKKQLERQFPLRCQRQHM
jgi:hypothetical protein